MAVGGKRPMRKKRMPWYKKKYSAMELAGKAWSAVKYVKGMINCEKKTVDINASITGVTYNGSVTSLSAIAQGDTSITRDGKSILAKSLLIRGSVVSNASASFNVVRVIVFQDRYNTGTAPTASNLLETTGSASAPYSALNHLASGRFKILYTRLIFVVASSEAKVIPFKAYIPLNTHVKYDGPNSTDDYKNSLYCCFISATAPAGTNPDVNLYSRMSFYDN